MIALGVMDVRTGCHMLARTPVARETVDSSQPFVLVPLAPREGICVARADARLLFLFDLSVCDPRAFGYGRSAELEPEA